MSRYAGPHGKAPELVRRKRGMRELWATVFIVFPQGGTGEAG